MSTFVFEQLGDQFEEEIGRHILALEQLDQPVYETGRHARAMVELINRYRFEAEQHIKGVGTDRTLLLTLAIFAFSTPPLSR